MSKQTTNQRRPNLTQSLAKRFRTKINSGELKPGDKLPSEKELVVEFGVSRTVVREAIAGLNADGLVESRHGVGVFVLDPPPSTNEFELIPERLQRVSSVIETLELRAAVEVEAAAIAAQRHSPGQITRIQECFLDMVNTATGDNEAVAADYAFHMAIAEATNNPQFTAFLQFLGRKTIPRSQVFRPAETPEDANRREARILSEHEIILKAISARDPDAAREAMRTHLKGSQERYQRLLSYRNNK